MKCANCNFKNSEGNIFCEKCGTKLAEPLCSKCVTAVKENTMFCAICGTKRNGQTCVNEQNPYATQTLIGSQRNKNKLIWILGSALLVVAAVVVAVLLFGAPGSPADQLNEYYAYLSDKVFNPQNDFTIETDLSRNDKQYINRIENYINIKNETLEKVERMSVPQGLKDAHNSLIGYLDKRVYLVKTEYEYILQKEQEEIVEKRMEIGGEIYQDALELFNDWIDGIKEYEKENDLPEYIPSAFFTFDIYTADFPNLAMNLSLNAVSPMGHDLGNESSTNMTQSEDNAAKIAAAINLTNKFNSVPVQKPDRFDISVFKDIDAKSMQSIVWYWWPQDLWDDDKIEAALQWLDYDGKGKAIVRKSPQEY